MPNPGVPIQVIAGGLDGGDARLPILLKVQEQIERLNTRIRELSGTAGRATSASEPERRGFFRR